MSIRKKTLEGAQLVLGLFIYDYRGMQWYHHVALVIALALFIPGFAWAANVALTLSDFLIIMFCMWLGISLTIEFAAST